MPLKRSVSQIVRQTRWPGLALGVGAALAIAGCGGSSQPAGAVASSAAQRPAVTGHTATRPPAALTGTTTLRRARPRTQPAALRAGPLIRALSGTASQRIGSIAEKKTVVLVWTAAQAPIQIFTSHGNLLVSSHARNGRIRLAFGHYRGLRVATPGHWTLALRVAA